MVALKNQTSWVHDIPKSRKRTKPRGTEESTTIELRDRYDSYLVQVIVEKIQSKHSEFLSDKRGIEVLPETITLDTPGNSDSKIFRLTIHSPIDYPFLDAYGFNRQKSYGGLMPGLHDYVIEAPDPDILANRLGITTFQLHSAYDALRHNAPQTVPGILKK